MSTELARIEDVQTVDLDRGRWELIASQAEMMAKTTIVPKEFQGSPANLMAAGLMGQRFGWDIITAANNIEVVSGNPQLKIHALNALIRGAGHYLNGEADNEQATITGKRGDTGEQMTVTFTLEDGKRAGVAGNWGKYPADHLWAKALRRLAKRLFADVALNLANDVDDEPAHTPPPSSIDAAIDAVLAPPAATRELPAAEAQPLPGHHTLSGTQLNELVELRKKLGDANLMTPSVWASMIEEAGAVPGTKTNNLTVDQATAVRAALMELDK